MLTALISDRSQQLFALINCQVEADFILCGIAIFRGGLSGVVKGYDQRGNEYQLIVPASVRECATFDTKLSVLDDIKIQRLKAFSATPVPKSLPPANHDQHPTTVQFP